MTFEENLKALIDQAKTEGRKPEAMVLLALAGAVASGQEVELALANGPIIQKLRMNLITKSN